MSCHLLLNYYTNHTVVTLMSSSPIELLHKPHGGNFDVLSSPIELLHKPHGGNFDVLSSPIELLHKPHGGNFDVFISY